MLSLVGIKKTFNGHDAVKNVDLEIHPGEFFSILGPSGCGKTTLLRILGGFEKPSQGEILLDGRRIDTLPPHERECNTVFQRYALFPHLDVFKNVAFGLEMRKMKDPELSERVRAALDLVQMRDYERRSVTTLSGGQQQRIALARAFVNRPKVLLLDEPLSALDLKLRQQMKVELLSLQRKLKQTFIFVTHDQEEALTISDRVAVMNQGIVEQVGTPQEIYEYPKSLFVAHFIGSMNSIECEVKEFSSEIIHLKSPLSNRIMHLKPARDGLRPLPLVSEGIKVQMMVRPEKLKLTKTAPSLEHNSFEGVISEILYRGPETQFFIQPRLQQKEIQKESQSHGEVSAEKISVVQTNSALTAKRIFGTGDRVFISWAPEDCLLMGLSGPLPLPSIAPLAEAAAAYA